MPLDGRSLGIALGINLAIATVAFGAFFMLLRSRYTRRFFLPKLYSSEVDDSKRPRRWAGGLPELLRNLWSYPQAEIAQVAGHDGATYLRCVEFGWNVFIPLTVYCLLVVLPVNYSGGQVDSLMAAQAPAPAVSSAYRFSRFTSRIDDFTVLRSLKSMLHGLNTIGYHQTCVQAQYGTVWHCRSVPTLATPIQLPAGTRDWHGSP